MTQTGTGFSGTTQASLCVARRRGDYVVGQYNRQRLTALRRENSTVRLIAFGRRQVTITVRTYLRAGSVRNDDAAASSVTVRHWRQDARAAPSIATDLLGSTPLERAFF